MHELIKRCRCVFVRRGSAGWLLAGAVALAMSSPGMCGGEGARRFEFDAGFRGSPGLGFSFWRPYATFARDGQPVAQNQARYAEATLATSAPYIEVLRESGADVIYMGSGVDHDGETPLLVVFDKSAGAVDVYSVSDDAMAEAVETGVGRTRTDVSLVWAPVADIMQGAVPFKLYRPTSGAVCHGLIVLACNVYTLTGPNTWESSAIAYATSQDRGQTWSLHFEDASAQVGAARMREWSLQNWWPMARGEAPLEAWFAMADYRYQTATTGGRIATFRATRDTAGGAWTLSDTVVPITAEGSERQHFHAGGVVPYGESGARLFVGIGDGLPNNRIASATVEDRSDIHGPWTVKHDYHGSTMTKGFQFVGVAPGPWDGTALLGADENADQILLIEPDDDPNSRARPVHVYGESFESGEGSRNFSIQTPFPEHGGPYVATYSSSNNVFGPPASRVLYSPDGLHWGQAYRPGTNSGASVAIHGSYIYFDEIDLLDVIARTKIPDSRVRRPLVVGPGGVNRVTTFTPVPQPTSTNNALRLLSPAERAALDPQPPCSGPVYEVEALPNGERLLAVLRPAFSARVFPPGPYHARLWGMLLTPEYSTLDVSAGDPGYDFPPARSMGNRAMRDEWFSVTLRDEYGPIAPGQLNPNGEYLFEMRLRANEGEEAFRMYVAVDTVSAGAGFPGFSIAPNTSAPDEIAMVDGFSCSDSWTISLAGLLPDDAWDATTRFTTEWPLATLYGGPGDHVQIVANSQEGTLSARVTSGGAFLGTMTIPDVFWLRGSPALISVSSRPGASGRPGVIEMTASVAGKELASAGVDGQLGSQPSEIRFSAPDQTAVAPFCWFGGEVRESQYLDLLERVDLLTSLDFIDAPPGVVGDVNNDGIVDFSDLNAVLSQFGLSGAGLLGDWDGDGMVDFSDLNAVLANFGGGGGGS